MAEFSFKLNDGSDPDEVKKANKTLNWLLQNLDHSNVTRLHTEYVDIRSEAGEMIIDGPLVTMRGATTTIRLKMGREGSDFVFNLYNSTGGLTVDINSSGYISAYNFVAYDSLTVRQASVVAASITIGDGLGGVTPATITYSGQDVPVADVQLSLNSVSNISLNASTAGGFVRFTAAQTQVVGSLTVSSNITSSGSLTVKDSIASSNINSTGALVVKNSITSSSITCNGTINSTGTISINSSLSHLKTDRIQGYSSATKFFIGDSSCHLNVFGGDVRIVQNGGSYLQISNVGLFYVSSGVSRTVTVV